MLVLTVMSLLLLLLVDPAVGPATSTSAQANSSSAPCPVTWLPVACWNSVGTPELPHQAPPSLFPHRRTYAHKPHHHTHHHLGPCFSSFLLSAPHCFCLSGCPLLSSYSPLASDTHDPSQDRQTARNDQTPPVLNRPTVAHHGGQNGAVQARRPR